MNACTRTQRNEGSRCQPFEKTSIVVRTERAGCFVPEWLFGRTGERALHAPQPRAAGPAYHRGTAGNERGWHIGTRCISTHCLAMLRRLIQLDVGTHAATETEDCCVNAGAGFASLLDSRPRAFSLHFMLGSGGGRHTVRRQVVVSIDTFRANMLTVELSREATFTRSARAYDARCSACYHRVRQV